MIRDAYEEVVFGILEDHVDGLVFEDNLLQRYDILMADLPVELYPSIVNALLNNQSTKCLLQFLV